MRRFFLILLACVMPMSLPAQSFDDVIDATLRPGWRMADGSHMAALHMRLKPGWKTYWRAPGDAGIPPLFDWRGARNTTGIDVLWPAPEVFWQSGMRSIGYSHEVVLPLRVRLRNTGRDARLGGTIDLGICKDVCLPHRMRVSAELPADQRKPDPVIIAALADAPLSASEAGVASVRCTLSLQGAGLSLRAEISLPRAGQVDTVIEAADPQLWVAEPETRWSGNTLIAETELRHVDGGGFALDRSGVRITLLEKRRAVDIQGCPG